MTELPGQETRSAASSASALGALAGERSEMLPSLRLEPRQQAEERALSRDARLLAIGGQDVVDVLDHHQVVTVVSELLQVRDQRAMAAGPEDELVLVVAKRPTVGAEGDGVGGG